MAKIIDVNAPPRCSDEPTSDAVEARAARRMLHSSVVSDRHLLIVYHTQTGRTGRMSDAVLEGATDAEIRGVHVTRHRAADAGPPDLLRADGVILLTPENFGYMSGAMKDFFDRTFYAVEGKIQPLPYALVVSAGNDGTGAVRAVERIVSGYPLNAVQEPIIVVGEPSADDLQACRELGMAVAAGLEARIF